MMTRVMREQQLAELREELSAVEARVAELRKALADVWAAHMIEAQRTRTEVDDGTDAPA